MLFIHASFRLPQKQAIGRDLAGACVLICPVIINIRDVLSLDYYRVLLSEVSAPICMMTLPINHSSVCDLQCELPRALWNHRYFC